MSHPPTQRPLARIRNAADVCMGIACIWCFLMIVFFLSALPSLVRTGGLEPRFVDWANSFYAEYFLIALGVFWVYGTGRAVQSALANK